MVILHKSIRGLSAPALDRFVLVARRAAGLKGTVNVLVTSSAAMRSLNQKFRGKNQPTDVLSFPTPLAELGTKSGLAGEIAISGDIALQSALRLGHDVAEEVKILVLHGVLHLAGFDHERDNGKMAHKEASLRERLGLPSGLIERARGSAGKSLRDKRHTSGSRRTA